jgi:hypothetical protein
VGRDCGKCHTTQLEHFEASPHAFYAKDGSFKGCVACHGNHRIHTTVQAISGRCTPCHEAPDKEMKNFGALQELLARSRGEFTRTNERLAHATRAGFHTDDEQLLLEQAKTSLLQLPPLQHALNGTNVLAVTKTISGQLGEVEQRLQLQDRRERWKKFALFPIWLFLISMAWIFRAKRRQIEGSKP